MKEQDKGMKKSSLSYDGTDAKLSVSMDASETSSKSCSRFKKKKKPSHEHSDIGASHHLTKGNALHQTTQMKEQESNMRADKYVETSDSPTVTDDPPLEDVLEQPDNITLCPRQHHKKRKKHKKQKYSSSQQNCGYSHKDQNKMHSKDVSYKDSSGSMDRSVSKSKDYDSDSDSNPDAKGDHERHKTNEKKKSKPSCNDNKSSEMENVSDPEAPGSTGKVSERNKTDQPSTSSSGSSKRKEDRKRKNSNSITGTQKKVQVDRQNRGSSSSGYYTKIRKAMYRKQVNKLPLISKAEMKSLIPTL